MLLKFWGTRGSIPAPLRPEEVQQKIIESLQLAGNIKLDLSDSQGLRQFVNDMSMTASTVGSNTTCLSLEFDDHLIIFDAGSGMRELGATLMDSSSQLGQKFRFYAGQGHATIFFTHTHWDHIQGWPFFRPLHVPGNRFDIYHIHSYVPRALAQQMEAMFFPLQFDQINAQLTFHHIRESQRVEIGETHVTSIELRHPGKAYAYRVEAHGAVFVLATDGEYQNLDYTSMKKFYNFYHGADALVFDAMLSVRESFIKEDWGHSSALIGVDMALEASVKQLYLFHHDPVSSDAEIMRILDETQEYLSSKNRLLEVIIAQEGMEVELLNPSPVAEFKMDDAVRDGVIYITLTGKLDARVSEQFRKKLVRALQTHQMDRVILNMANLRELTIAGIRALVDARKHTLSLALVGMPDDIYRILVLAGTTDFFAIYDDEEAALAALNTADDAN